MIDIGGFFESQTTDCIVKTMKNRDSWNDDGGSTVCTIHALISLSSSSGLASNGDEESSSSDATIFFDDTDIRYESDMSASDISIGCSVSILGIEYEIIGVDLRGVLPVIGATRSITARRTR